MKQSLRELDNLYNTPYNNLIPSRMSMKPNSLPYPGKYALKNNLKIVVDTSSELRLL